MNLEVNDTEGSASLQRTWLRFSPNSESRYQKRFYCDSLWQLLTLNKELQSPRPFPITLSQLRTQQITLYRNTLSKLRAQQITPMRSCTMSLERDDTWQRSTKYGSVSTA